MSLTSASSHECESIDITLIGRVVEPGAISPAAVPSESMVAHSSILGESMLRQTMLPQSMLGQSPGISELPSLPEALAATHTPESAAVNGTLKEICPGTASELLQSRLQAASIVCLVCMLTFFARALWIEEPVVQLMRALGVIIPLGCLGLLLTPDFLAPQQLRRIELMLFGPLCALVVLLQVIFLMRAVESGDTPQQVAVVYSGTLGLAVLMLAYGMLMPNGWRRTALMMVPPTISPTLAMVIVRLLMPTMAESIDLHRGAEICFSLIVISGIATYGTYALSRLRNEVRKAKQLGQYKLRQQLGQGGMGQVFLGEHQLLKRPCAIKVIRAEQVGDPSALKRFEREVRSTAQLSHWNTIEIFDYGHTDDGTFYYVMEYMRGLNLHELVERYGPLPPARTIHFLTQTCWALQEAHNLGLIHRDLKPDNIFAAKRGGVYDVTKLFDFGLVMQNNEYGNIKSRHDPNATTPFAGSPLYMSPEQVTGMKLDGRTDVYSLGAVGYFLLTGRPPFDGKSAWKVMQAHAREPLTPPSTWNRAIPRDLEAVIIRCLSKDASGRFGSPKEMAEALHRCRDAGAWTYEHGTAWWKERAMEIDPTLLNT
jgi:eukaryotic-like serine/threonine-protein kinase